MQRGTNCWVSCYALFSFSLIIFALAMKYKTPDSQNEILPNLLGLISAKDVAYSEFEGFLKAEIILTESLTSRTKFNTAYILKIHKLSLAHLYSFAGKYRDVNLSQGGFPFAAAKFLTSTMDAFQKDHPDHKTYRSNTDRIPQASQRIACRVG